MRHLALPKYTLRPSTQLTEAVLSFQDISEAYFSWAHLWMPVISKSRWYGLHLKPLGTFEPHIKLLLLCMKLVTWKPGYGRQERQPRSEDYLLAKQTIFEAENVGHMTIQVLQAMLLVAVYEYAHAIYPAAYMTIAACSRYAMALRLHKQRQRDVDLLDLSLDGQEERRRVWWAIIIMDRLLYHSQPNSIEPDPEDLLPMHDQSWDDNMLDSRRIYTVSSPATTHMGMLARLSQASYLLGRVLRHKNNPTNDSVFDCEERSFLQHALQALLNLTYEEGSTRLMPICPQTALCLSAMAILNSYTLPETATYQPSMLVSTDGAQAKTVNLLRCIADESLLNIERYYRRRPWSLERSSPLLLHWSFIIAVTFLKLSRLENTSGLGYASSFGMEGHTFTQSEALRGYKTMRRKLTLLGQQWCAASEYLDILDARAEIAIGGM
jgi:hypothetical protein